MKYEILILGEPASGKSNFLRMLAYKWTLADSAVKQTKTPSMLLDQDIFEGYVVDRTHKSMSGFDDAIKKFWADLPDYIVPLLLEIRMYHKKYMFAGTADILLYNTRTGQIYIADYKTNKDLFKNYQGQRMTGPFSHLLCSPFNHYKLQLSYYQILLEQIGIKVSGRKLIWLKKEGDYLLYNLDDYSDVLRTELETKGI